jgi:hypothetical protein
VLLENLHNAFGLFANFTQMILITSYVTVKSSESLEGRRNLMPIENLLNCCGATIETKHQYIQDKFCPGELANSVSSMDNKINTDDSPHFLARLLHCVDHQNRHNGDGIVGVWHSAPYCPTFLHPLLRRFVQRISPTWSSLLFIKIDVN